MHSLKRVITLASYLGLTSTHFQNAASVGFYNLPKRSVYVLDKSMTIGAARSILNVTLLLTCNIREEPKF